MARMPEITIPVLPLATDVDGQNLSVLVERDTYTDTLKVAVAGSLLDALPSAPSGVWQLSHAIATALLVTRSERAAG